MLDLIWKSIIKLLLNLISQFFLNSQLSKKTSSELQSFKSLIKFKLSILTNFKVLILFLIGIFLKVPLLTPNFK